MHAFASTPAPVHTLWDAPQTAEQRLPGIWSVSTASHGGFVLSDERQAAMPEALRLDSIYYEEDVDWSLIVLAFEAEFAALRDPLFDLERDLARPGAVFSCICRIDRAADHHLHQRREVALALPAKCPLRLARVAHEQVDLGRTQEALVEGDVVLVVEAGDLEGDDHAATERERAAARQTGPHMKRVVRRRGRSVCRRLWDAGRGRRWRLSSSGLLRTSCVFN